MDNQNDQIRVKPDTKAKLDKLGMKGDSYNDIIEKLLEKASKRRKPNGRSN